MSALQNPAAMAVSETDTVPFVINLCSSTTPMALNYPATPELKRFSFFVSRRREDGRERFRLHMGYFNSAAEAEEWVAVVRDIYPGAWASEAPGRKLRAAQAAAAKAPALAAKPELAASKQTAMPAPVPPAPAALAPVALASAVPATAVAAPAAPVPAARSQAKSTQPLPDAALAPVAVPSPGPAITPRPAPFVPTLHAAPTLKEPPVVHPAAPVKTAFEESNLREVLAALETRTPPELSDTQVLALLEKRGTSKQTPPDSSIRMVKPDDTVTRRALTEAVQNNAPVSFAVQLQWSVQPVDLRKVPPLAIFNAYTLYTIDGSRDGRKWYGLRLGFFSDANSAKQVAQYVRSEFVSVAVVPVTTKELEHASAPKAAATAPAKAEALASQSGEFKLVDDAPRQLPPAPVTSPAANVPAHSPLGRVRAAAAAGHATMASAEAGKRKAGKQAENKPYRAPQTLEETLEILGAGRIEIDNGRGEFLNDTSVRHMEVTPVKNSAFSRLLDRITEAVRKS